MVPKLLPTMRIWGLENKGRGQKSSGAETQQKLVIARVLSTAACQTGERAPSRAVAVPRRAPGQTHSMEAPIAPATPVCRGFVTKNCARSIAWEISEPVAHCASAPTAPVRK